MMKFFIRLFFYLSIIVGILLLFIYMIYMKDKNDIDSVVNIILKQSTQFLIEMENFVAILQR